jgi:hypothetical protein
VGEQRRSSLKSEARERSRELRLEGEVVRWGEEALREGEEALRAGEEALREEALLGGLVEEEGRGAGVEEGRGAGVVGGGEKTGSLSTSTPGEGGRPLFPASNSSFSAAIFRSHISDVLEAVSGPRSKSNTVSAA